MTGPEQYVEAERLRNAAVKATDNPFPHLTPSELLAAALVHATLALAAATAMAARSGENGLLGMGSRDFYEWDQAAGL